MLHGSSLPIHENGINIELYPAIMRNNFRIHNSENGTLKWHSAHFFQTKINIQIISFNTFGK